MAVTTSEGIICQTGCPTGTRPVADADSGSTTCVPYPAGYTLTVDSEGSPVCVQGTGLPPWAT